MFPQIWLLIQQNDGGQAIQAYITLEAAQAAIKGPGMYRVEPIGVQGLAEGYGHFVGPRQPAEKPKLATGADLHSSNDVRGYIARTDDIAALRSALDWAYQVAEASSLRDDERVQRLLGLL